MKYDLLETAIEMSNKSYGHFKHGCLIIRKGYIVASAWNNESGHAEMNAIKNLQKEQKGKNFNKLRRFLHKCSILVIKNHLSNSKPCTRCLEKLKNYGFRKVYYSYDKKIIVEKTNQMENDHLSSKYRKPWSSFT